MAGNRVFVSWLSLMLWLCVCVTVVPVASESDAHAHKLRARHAWEHLSHHAQARTRALASIECADLCWSERVEFLNLDIYNTLTDCMTLNITQRWGWQPEMDSVTEQRVMLKGGYAYRNQWLDFSIGDDAYAFQSWRTRWLWNVDLGELVYTQLQVECESVTGRTFANKANY